ncbi:MAG: M20/M25/M40 family metallo-hydrolase [Bacteroidia bacterium]|nr:M20/M25/M40 family metallo-hydrolase [Bacteroidia bacterium]
MIDIAVLLKRLIEIPSTSKNESAKADFLYNELKNKAYDVHRFKDNLWCMAFPYDTAKPTIMLNSHIDTVKPNVSWTYEPNKATEVDGRIYGLGSNDAHASVVALIETFLRLKQTKQSYNLILALSAQEEVSGKDGIESLLTELPKIDFAIVGEPTGMRLAVAEKGLMVLDCVAHGKSGHAARDEGDNAIYKALPDMEWFRTFEFPKISDTLGKVKMSVTIVNSGTQHNVVPDTCSFTVDVRLTDCYSHEDVLSIVRQNVSCDVTPRSMRLRPSGVPLSNTFVKRYIATGGSVFGSSTMSDQALMPFASVKIGPGDSARSHTADEYIELSEISKAVDIYYNLLDGLIMI